MTPELFALEDGATSAPEFVGFEALSAEPALVPFEASPVELPLPAKKPRRTARSRKQPHSVRVWFDDRELLKLNTRANAAGLSLAEYVRARALREARSRSEQTIPPTAADLFVPSEPAPAQTECNPTPISSDLDARITAYYSPDGGTATEPNTDKAQSTAKPGRKAWMALCRAARHTDYIGYARRWLPTGATARRKDALAKLGRRFARLAGAGRVGRQMQLSWAVEGDRIRKAPHADSAGGATAP
jgi:hypothetical protein